MNRKIQRKAVCCRVFHFVSSRFPKETSRSPRIIPSCKLRCIKLRPKLPGIIYAAVLWFRRWQRTSSAIRCRDKGFFPGASPRDLSNNEKGPDFRSDNVTQYCLVQEELQEKEWMSYRFSSCQSRQSSFFFLQHFRF